MSKAWEGAQDRLRRRIWAARAADEDAGLQPQLSAFLQPPELVAPEIESHRTLAGRPVRVLKRTLHRLLVPLVFAPQAEFNLRVAAQLNEAAAEHRNQSTQEIADGLAELRGDVLALRGELQAQRALLEKGGQDSALAAGDAGHTRSE